MMYGSWEVFSDLGSRNFVASSRAGVSAYVKHHHSRTLMFKILEQGIRKFEKPP